MSSNRGLSIIELVIYMGIAGFIAVWAANYLRVPFKVDQAYQRSQTERDLVRAMDSIVNDLREADPMNLTSVMLALSTSTTQSTLQFTKSTFKVTDPDNPDKSTINYGAAVSNGRTSLVRTETPPIGLSTATLTYTTPPVPNSSLQLLFSRDAVSPTVINISLIYQAPGIDPVQMSRQVAVRN